MNTKISPAQAEAALDAIESMKIKHVGSKAGYALAKNVLVFNKVLKGFHAFRDATRAEMFAPGEKIEPSSEKAAEFTAKVHPAAQAPVEVELHSLKLSDLLAVWGEGSLTTLTSLDFFIEDDLGVDSAEPAK